MRLVTAAAGTTKPASVRPRLERGSGPGFAHTASITAGIPTVKAVIADALRSAIGKTPMMSDETMRAASVAIRVRKSARIPCIPLTIRWPSSTAGASAANESFMRTMSATPRVAWLPLCIATATLARLRESTSFTPSPIIAT